MSREILRPLRGFFVSGTGTDVGQSVATAALLRALRHRGLAVQAVKPVQTGVEDAAREGDAALYAAAAGDTADRLPAPAATLHAFRIWPQPARGAA